MTKEEVLYHWKYFLSLEKDLVRLKDYIEINEDNFDTYSFELLKILQLSCAEIDSVCQMLCKKIDHNDKSDDIKSYKKNILKEFPDISKAEIFIPDLNKKIRPWEEWEEWTEWKNEKAPSWWKAHNNVKHERHNNFNKANLKNTLYAITGLAIVILYLYRIVVNEKKAHPSPMPTYFDSDYFSPFIVTHPKKELPSIETEITEPIQKK